MPNLSQAISDIRDSVVAVLRVHMSKPAKQKKGKIRPPQFKVSFVGTAWCIVKNKYMVTAHHIFNLIIIGSVVKRKNSQIITQLRYLP